ncbi:MAG: mechanosensitive ion channel family protein, partial [Gammaproteobacteria bacterium]|nr:mechanosensitive ion channel family protein [Gammaproteobacteria bacterium]
LLANRAYRRGDFIRVINIDNYIEGYISEINLFNTKLISENREVIIYPNNLLLALPTIINPKDRYSIVGKTTEFTPCENKAESQGK